jgi:hypothetical protein
MMEILELLHAKLNIARRVLTDLVGNYRILNDDQRLEKSSIVMDNINSYLQIQENLVFPVIARSGMYDDMLFKGREVHERIEYVLEHAIQVHVDEPGFEYYDFLNQLLGLLDLAERTDRETIFVWAETYLSKEDEYHMIAHLREQTAHETPIYSEKPVATKPNPGTIPGR